ncbi:hypothetical protein WJX81_001785, partial [Elliptochloris bilobata]
NSLELVVDAEPELRRLLAYPLADTLASAGAAPVLEDNFLEVANAVVAAWDAGELGGAAAGEPDAFKAWVKALGKAQKRKGKRLFMPLRIALTGAMAGPDVGEILALLALEDGDVADRGAYVPLPERIEALRTWAASAPAPPA